MAVRTSHTRSIRRGLLITFEGVEGSGKSTQCAKLAASLRQHGYPVVETREPGGTPLAERIRTLLLAKPAARSSASKEPIDPRCETHLILACRSQHVARVIAPALRKGAVVLCDRFLDSTLAYQGYGRGLDREALLDLHRFATQGLAPDLTLLFDLPVAAGLARRRGERGVVLNRMDRETRRFHERVRRGFLDLASRHPRRIKVLDASPDPDRIAARVSAIVGRFLTPPRKTTPSKRRTG